MIPLTKEQQEKENSDPTLKRTEEELSREQAILNSANTSLWSAILTINGIFLAFSFNFLNKCTLPHVISATFSILFAIPILLILCLFYLSRTLRKENFKTYQIIHNVILGNLREIDTTDIAKDAIGQDKRARKINKRFKIINNCFEIVSIFMTFISVLLILILILIN
jgi:hypothetical protein